MNLKSKLPEPSDMPLTVCGPRGQRRRVVTADSIGFGICHYPMDEGSDRLWDFDYENGVLHFNVRHPHWVRIDKRDTWVVQFQNWMILQVLTLVSTPEGFREVIRDTIDRQVAPYSEFIIIPGTRKRTTKAG